MNVRRNQQQQQQQLKSATCKYFSRLGLKFMMHTHHTEYMRTRTHARILSCVAQCKSMHAENSKQSRYSFSIPYQCMNVQRIYAFAMLVINIICVRQIMKSKHFLFCYHFTSPRRECEKRRRRRRRWWWLESKVRFPVFFFCINAKMMKANRDSDGNVWVSIGA